MGAGRERETDVSARIELGGKEPRQAPRQSAVRRQPTNSLAADQVGRLPSFPLPDERESVLSYEGKEGAFWKVKRKQNLGALNAIQSGRMQ